MFSSNPALPPLPPLLPAAAPMSIEAAAAPAPQSAAAPAPQAAAAPAVLSAAAPAPQSAAAPAPGVAEMLRAEILVTDLIIDASANNSIWITDTVIRKSQQTKVGDLFSEKYLTICDSPMSTEKLPLSESKGNFVAFDLHVAWPYAHGMCYGRSDIASLDRRLQALENKAAGEVCAAWLSVCAAPHRLRRGFRCDAAAAGGAPPPAGRARYETAGEVIADLIDRRVSAPRCASSAHMVSGIAYSEFAKIVHSPPPNTPPARHKLSASYEVNSAAQKSLEAVLSNLPRLHYVPSTRKFYCDRELALALQPIAAKIDLSAILAGAMSRAHALGGALFFVASPDLEVLVEKCAILDGWKKFNAILEVLSA